MTVSTSPLPAAAHFAVPPEPVLPLTLKQYHAMIRAGILESGSPIELLEGWLVTKTVYWIVNLVDGRLEAFAHPSGADYADRRVFEPGDEVPVILDGKEIGRIAVRDLLA
jgi:hypothetical protein